MDEGQTGRLLQRVRERLGPQAPRDPQALPAALEQALWADPSPDLESLYQECCRVLAAEDRHRWVVVIPVAERPRQLAACLESLLAAQRAFGHAPQAVVVEDSEDPGAVAAHAAVIRRLRGEGLEVHHLGPEEQWGLVAPLAERLPGFLGSLRREGMGHKGASVTRNIAKLWLARQSPQNALFHFIDSDQAFHLDEQAGRPRLLLDHAGHIDRLFRSHPLEVLTGKVIGDPPVSPAVMAGTLLQDLTEILDGVLSDPAGPCPFHGGQAGAGHGAYHDMARLFGLEAAARDFRYACPLPPPHSGEAMLGDLGGRLGRFFDGEHPTRVTPFDPVAVAESLAPARTVYTGNYVLSRAGLRHGIPFADLKLRMAGPTLGRLLQARLGPAFAQANLPLLHRRTEAASGRAEYRPGVERDAGGVDLSGEYRRQFLGDWMLFGIAELTADGYPDAPLDGRAVAAALQAVEARLLTEYRRVREMVMARLADLDRRLSGSPVPAPFAAFAETVRRNYGPEAPAVRAIEDAGFRDRWRARLAQAIRDYPQQRERWEEAF